MPSEFADSAIQDMSAGQLDGRFQTALQDVFAENDTNDGNLTLTKITNGMTSAIGSQASHDLLPVQMRRKFNSGISIYRLDA